MTLLERIKRLFRRPKTGAGKQKAHEGTVEIEPERPQKAAPQSQPASIKRQKKTGRKRIQKPGKHKRVRRR